MNNSTVYQDSLRGGGNTQFGQIGLGDIAILGGTFLRHEKDHRDDRSVDTSEYAAFRNQSNLLNKINSSKKPFKNQEYFKDISRGIQTKIADAKIREGIK